MTYESTSIDERGTQRDHRSGARAPRLALSITSLLVGQRATGPIAGSWTATFDGRTFIRLEIKTVNGAISGGICLGNFQVDSKGMVKRADTAPPNLTPMFDIRRKGETVTFATKDGNDTDHFEFRLLDNGDAELRVLLNDEDRKSLAADGVPLPKPIRLTNAG